MPYPYTHFPAPRRLCACGSSKFRRALNDARGIFVAYVCDDCEETKRARYRPEIFNDPDYWHDEEL